MNDNEYIGKTLCEIMASNFMIAHGFAEVSIFVKDPNEDPTLPGKKYAENLNLGLILESHSELNNAKVVVHNMYYDMNVFRVVLH